MHTCTNQHYDHNKVTGFRYGAFPTQKLKNCCATGESCCRWCPQYVCPYLEEGYYIPVRLRARCVRTHSCVKYFILSMQIVGYRNRRLTASVHMRLTTSMYMHHVFTTGARAMDEQKLWYALCSNYDGDLNPQSINVA